MFKVNINGLGLHYKLFAPPRGIRFLNMSWNNESKHYIIVFHPDQGTEKHVHMGGIKKKCTCWEE
jgi:hypothetical protein